MQSPELYLQVQSSELLFLLSWIAFVFLNGPGWLATYPSWWTGEPHISVQRAVFHVGLDRRVEVMRWKHLLSQVGILGLLLESLHLGELILTLSICLRKQWRINTADFNHCRKIFTTISQIYHYVQILSALLMLHTHTHTGLIIPTNPLMTHKYTHTLTIPTVCCAVWVYIRDDYYCMKTRVLLGGGRDTNTPLLNSSTYTSPSRWEEL